MRRRHLSAALCASLHAALSRHASHSTDHSRNGSLLMGVETSSSASCLASRPEAAPPSHRMHELHCCRARWRKRRGSDQGQQPRAAPRSWERCRHRFGGACSRSRVPGAPSAPSAQGTSPAGWRGQTRPRARRGLPALQAWPAAAPLALRVAASHAAGFREALAAPGPARCPCSLLVRAPHGASAGGWRALRRPACPGARASS
mmetsp:Transcript_107627/g.299816  ORF Transcript_107627/g.299816 Transcript_107627/m.299816 type:complete len:203 (+) Transcript_107627:204-812(+)